MIFLNQNRSCHASPREASVWPSRETLREARGDNTRPMWVGKFHHCVQQVSINQTLQALDFLSCSISQGSILFNRSRQRFGSPPKFCVWPWHPQGVLLLCYGFAGPSIVVAPLVGPRGRMPEGGAGALPAKKRGAPGSVLGFDNGCVSGLSC